MGSAKCASDRTPASNRAAREKPDDARPCAHLALAARLKPAPALPDLLSHTRRVCSCPSQYKKFCAIDTDHSGRLDENEFIRFIASYKTLKKIPPSQSRTVFQILDPQNSGYVTYKELSRAVFPTFDAASLTAVDWGTYRNFYEPGHDASEAGDEEEPEPSPRVNPAGSTQRHGTQLDMGRPMAHGGTFDWQAEVAQLRAHVENLHTSQETLQAGQERVQAQLASVQQALDFLVAAEKRRAGPGAT